MFELSYCYDSCCCYERMWVKGRVQWHIPIGGDGRVSLGSSPTGILHSYGEMTTNLSSRGAQIIPMKLSFLSRGILSLTASCEEDMAKDFGSTSADVLQEQLPRLMNGGD